MQIKRAAPKKIVIVGGGTAGWMAANWLQHHWREQDVTISLIESSEIGIIGVGEGSTPYLKNYFRSLGLQESEWMPACNATYKSGISFPGWANLPGNTNYFHPFFTHMDIHSGEAFFANACLRRRGSDVPAHPNDFFVTAALARAKLAPVPLQMLPHEPDYAYHFDSGLLGNFLAKRAGKLGVQHFTDTVLNVLQDSTGEITGVLLRDQGFVQGDFFIDCTGFASVLMNKALKEPFISFGDNLLNDRAVAMPTPLDNTLPIPVETVSRAMKYGWAWKIPLINRYGNGYVYSSAFVSSEQAEQELRQHLGGAAEGQEVRHLSMRVGRITNHWSKNCLALGLSQGFIEPLEATALMLVQFTLQMFTDGYDSADALASGRATLNRKINKMFGGVRDYIVAHYKINSRTDTDYWLANKNNPHISDHLQAILEAWDKGMDFEAKLSELRATQVYLRPSWYCLLAGMGRFPENLKACADEAKLRSASLSRQYCDATAKKLFQDHRDYLRSVYGDLWPVTAPTK